MSKVVKQLKKKSGAISVLAEFSRDERLVHHDLSDLSRACRSRESSHVTASACVCATRAAAAALRLLISCALDVQGDGSRRHSGASGPGRWIFRSAVSP